MRPSLLMASALVYVLSSLGAQAVTATANLSPGGPFSVDDTFALTLETSSDFPEILGFAATLDYDADALRLDNIAVHSSFDTIFVPILPVSPTGTTSVMPITGGVFAGPGPSGAQTLVTLSFTALSVGDTTVMLSEVFGEFITDESGASLFNGPVSALVSIEASSGDVTAPVPLPAPFLLLAGGLGALGLMIGRGRSCRACA